MSYFLFVCFMSIGIYSKTFWKTRGRLSMRNRTKTIQSNLISALSLLIALIMLSPIIWGLFCSIQYEGKQFHNVFSWFTPPYTLQNYPQVLLKTGVFRWFCNSLIVAVVTTALSVLVSTLAAYSIAHISFKGSGFFYFLFSYWNSGSQWGNDYSFICINEQIKANW